MLHVFHYSFIFFALSTFLILDFVSSTYHYYTLLYPRCIHVVYPFRCSPYHVLSPERVSSTSLIILGPPYIDRTLEGYIFSPFSQSPCCFYVSRHFSSRLVSPTIIITLGTSNVCRSPGNIYDLSLELTLVIFPVPGIPHLGISPQLSFQTFQIFIGCAFQYIQPLSTLYEFPFLIIRSPYFSHSKYILNIYSSLINSSFHKTYSDLSCPFTALHFLSIF